MKKGHFQKTLYRNKNIPLRVLDYEHWKNKIISILNPCDELKWKLDKMLSGHVWEDIIMDLLYNEIIVRHNCFLVVINLPTKLQWAMYHHFSTRGESQNLVFVTEQRSFWKRLFDKFEYIPYVQRYLYTNSISIKDFIKNPR